jgi:hypothetical protein
LKLEKLCHRENIWTWHNELTGTAVTVFDCFAYNCHIVNAICHIQVKTKTDRCNLFFVTIIVFVYTPLPFGDTHRSRMCGISLWSCLLRSRRQWFVENANELEAGVIGGKWGLIFLVL